MNCIVCNIPTGGMAFFGIKKGLAVTFCKQHVEDCVKCDECTGQIVLK